MTDGVVLPPPPPMFTLMAKPVVFRREGRWWVSCRHGRGTYMQGWRTHLAAMNCALALARTSDWRLPPHREDWSPKAL